MAVLCPTFLCARARGGSPANGELHFVIPRKLLLFRDPAPLPPGGPPWRNADARDGPAAAGRLFGPAFYAGLLRDLGVRLVFAIGGPAYDRAPLDAAGLVLCTMCDLGARADSPADRPSLQVQGVEGGVEVGGGLQR